MPVKLAATPCADFVDLLLPAMADSAKTSDEHRLVKARLEATLVAGKKRLAELEAGRERSAIDGTSRDNSEERRRVSDEIENLGFAVAQREKLRDEAETKEILAARDAGAAAAHAMMDEAVAAMVEYNAALEHEQTAKANYHAVIARMNEKQQHALRAVAQGAAPRSLVCSEAQIRGAAAEKCSRPFLGPSASGPMTMLDNIQVRGKIVMESINAFCVHAGDAHIGKRSDVLVDIRPKQGPQGETIVVPTSVGGRPFGGYGSGVS